MPKISIIIPVYKVEKYLDRCVQSVLNQSFSDFEVILVDDGSPDQCPRLCEKYKEQDERVVVLHRQNGGLSAARNSGLHWVIENSNSEWVTFIDSDDWIDMFYLDALYNAAILHNCNVAVANFKRVCEFQSCETSSYQIREINTVDFFREQRVNAVIAWGKLFKKSEFLMLSFPEGKIHEDEFTTYKILFRYKTIAWIEQPLYFYFQNENGIMAEHWTPKRLFQIEALTEQIAFFKKSGFADLVDSTRKLLITLIVTQYEQCNAVGQYPMERRKLIRALRKILYEERRRPLLEWGWLYEIAVFGNVDMYWKIKSFAYDIKKKVWR